MTMRLAAGAALLLMLALPLQAAGTGDTRETIALAPAVAEELRAGMRIYLESVQGIVEAMATAKSSTAAEAARKSGESMLGAKALVAGLTLPVGFIGMSIDTHRKFDAFAREAASGAPRLQLLKSLNDILANCTSCHAAYRLGR
jgi:hypothetical protein